MSTTDTALKESEIEVNAARVLEAQARKSSYDASAVESEARAAADAVRAQMDVLSVQANAIRTLVEARGGSNDYFVFDPKRIVQAVTMGDLSLLIPPTA